MRFRDALGKLCQNRKCNLSDMYLGPNFVMKLREYVLLDYMAVLNLSKNNIGDKGALYLSQLIR